MTATAAPNGPLHDLAEAYLPVIAQAQQAMLLEEQLPAEVAQLVDELADRLTDWGGTAALVTDPYLANSLLTAVLAGEKGLRAANVDDQRRRVRVALEQVRQVLRDAAGEAPASENAPTREVVRFVVDTLTVPQNAIAELLGVSVRTLQRWAKHEAAPEGDDESRVRMVARTLAHLRHTYTAPGVVHWFNRPHPALGDQRPIDLLTDPANAPTLVSAAARSRSTVAS